jgi:Tfp pilus assembly protein PilN
VAPHGGAGARAAYSPPRPGPAPAGMPQADVPAPPRPTPPSVPPHAAPHAGADAATATQPAVPAAVHAAQQGTPPAPPAGEAPAARSKKTREGVPHPAFPDATARTMRILPIAADLLPPEITERRRLSTVRRLVVAGVAVVALLVAGWYGVAYQHTQQAYDEVDRVNEAKIDLQRERAKYTDVDTVQKQRKAITDQLRLVMARDMSWSALLTSLQQAAPKGVSVQSITGSLAVEGGTATTGAVIGSMTLTGTAPSKAAVAAYVETLGKVAGISNPFPTEATEGDGGLSYTIQVDITTASLGGRFSAPSAAPSASGGK